MPSSGRISAATCGLSGPRATPQARQSRPARRRSQNPRRTKRRRRQGYRGLRLDHPCRLRTRPAPALDPHLGRLRRPRTGPVAHPRQSCAPKQASRPRRQRSGFNRTLDPQDISRRVLHRPSRKHPRHVSRRRRHPGLTRLGRHARARRPQPTPAPCTRTTAAAISQSNRLGPVRGIKEGDTPTFLALIENGLNDPARLDLGGWGAVRQFRGCRRERCAARRPSSRDDLGLPLASRLASRVSGAPRLVRARPRGRLSPARREAQGERTPPRCASLHRPRRRPANV